MLVIETPRSDDEDLAPIVIPHESFKKASASQKKMKKKISLSTKANEDGPTTDEVIPLVTVSKTLRSADGGAELDQDSHIPPSLPTVHDQELVTSMMDQEEEPDDGHTIVEASAKFVPYDDVITASDSALLLKDSSSPNNDDAVVSLVDSMLKEGDDSVNNGDDDVTPVIPISLSPEARRATDMKVDDLDDLLDEVTDKKTKSNKIVPAPLETKDEDFKQVNDLLKETNYTILNADDQSRLSLSLNRSPSSAVLSSVRSALSSTTPRTARSAINTNRSTSRLDPTLAGAPLSARSLASSTNDISPRKDLVEPLSARSSSTVSGGEISTRKNTIVAKPSSTVADVKSALLDDRLSSIDKDFEDLFLDSLPSLSATSPSIVVKATTEKKSSKNPPPPPPPALPRSGGVFSPADHKSSFASTQPIPAGGRFSPVDDIKSTEAKVGAPAPAAGGRFSPVKAAPSVVGRTSDPLIFDDIEEFKL